jgi:hypothetical protein
MYQVLTFICAIGVAPSDCTKATALDIIELKAPTLQACMFNSQALIAGSSNDTLIKPEMGKTYSKTVCRAGAQQAAR